MSKSQIKEKNLNDVGYKCQKVNFIEDVFYKKVLRNSLGAA